MKIIIIKKKKKEKRKKERKSPRGRKFLMYNSVPAAALCVYCYWMEISLMLQLFYDTQEGRQSLAEAPDGLSFSLPALNLTRALTPLPASPGSCTLPVRNSGLLGRKTLSSAHSRLVFLKE